MLIKFYSQTWHLWHTGIWEMLVSYIVPLLASTCNSLFFPNEPQFPFSASLKKDVLNIYVLGAQYSRWISKSLWSTKKSHIESHLKQCVPYAVRVGSSLVLHFIVTSNTLVKICILWAVILIGVGSWILVAIHLLYLNWVIAFLILECMYSLFYSRLFSQWDCIFKIQFRLIQILNNAEMWCAASSVTRLLNLMLRSRCSAPCFSVCCRNRTYSQS